MPSINAFVKQNLPKTKTTVQSADLIAPADASFFSSLSNCYVAQIAARHHICKKEPVNTGSVFNYNENQSTSDSIL